MVTKFCTVASNICRYAVWNLLFVTFLAPRILRGFLEISKMFVPLL